MTFRVGLAGAAAAAVCLSAVGAQGAPKAGGLEAWDAAVAAVDPFGDTEDCPRQLPRLKALRARSDYPAKDPVRALKLLDGLRYCAEVQKDWKTAYAAVKDATAYDEASAQWWELRAELAANQGEAADVLASLQRAAELDPAAIKGIGEDTLDWFYGLYAYGKTPDPARAREVLSLFWGVQWVPADPARTADYYWMEYAARLLTAGQPLQASKVLHTLREPTSVYVVRLDPRFRAIVVSDGAFFDVRKTGERRLAELDALAAKAPNRLGVLNARADLLRRMGRPEAALELLDSVQGRMSRAPSEAGAFEDRDLAAADWWSTRAWTLYALGRFDEALGDARRGATLEQKDSADAEPRPNVNETLSLANMLLDLGRQQEALEVLRPLEARKDLTANERVSVIEGRGCAHGNLNDLKAVRADIKALEKLSAGDFSILRVWRCAEQYDEAAAAVIRLLKNPDFAPYVLLQLSDDPEPPFPTWGDAAVQRRLKALRGRADVQAAIAAIGGRLEANPLRF